MPSPYNQMPQGLAVGARHASPVLLLTTLIRQNT